MPFLIVFFAGVLSVFAYAPFGLFPLIPVLWAILFFLLCRAPSSARAAALSFLWGFGALLAGICWLYIALNRYGGVSAPISAILIALFCAALAIYYALAGWAFFRLKHNVWWRDALLAAAIWTLSEWLRGAVFPAFPWLSMGYSQTPPSPLAGWVPLFGSYGTGFLLILISALLAAAVQENSKRIHAILAITAIILGGAVLRAVSWTQPVGPATRFALVQTNVAQEEKWQADRGEDFLRLNYELLERNPAQVVVFPETSLPYLIGQLPTGYLDALRELARATKGDAIVGVITQDNANGIYNSAVSLGVSPTQTYSKRHLVPFGEFRPYMFGWFYDLANIPMSDLARGPANQPPLRIGGQRIAVDICYEDVFGEELLYALPEATIMLNMSNLAWYGDSHAQPQHLQMERMRAMETGRPMLSATNTGMTAVIDPHGQVTEVLPPFSDGVLKADVRGYQGMTPYARWGNWPVLVLAWSLVVWAVYCVARKNRSIR